MVYGKGSNPMYLSRSWIDITDFGNTKTDWLLEKLNDYIGGWNVGNTAWVTLWLLLWEMKSVNWVLIFVQPVFISC